MHGLHDRKDAGPRRPAADVRPGSATGPGRQRSWTLLTLLSIAQFMVVLDARS
jgi:hypothetical protein